MSIITDVYTLAVLDSRRQLQHFLEVEVYTESGAFGRGMTYQGATGTKQLNPRDGDESRYGGLGTKSR